MPVPTDTFWNIRKLNVVFAASALLLLASMLWLLEADHEKPWRGYQQDALVWEAAMTRDAEVNALSMQQVAQLQQLTAELDTIAAREKSNKKLLDLQDKLAAKKKEKTSKDLPMRSVKGEITPQVQLVEEAKLEQPVNPAKVAALEKKLAEIQGTYQAKYEEMSRIDIEIEELTKAINSELKAQNESQKKIEELTRKKKALETKLKTLEPGFMGKLGEKIRNAPLSDWFNPSERVQQVVVPDIRTDLNVLTIETIDRCQTCHVNIDNPRYDEATLLKFVERQVAAEEGQAIDSLSDPVQPVVMLDFWVKAAKAAAEQPEHRAIALGLKVIDEASLAKVNELRATATMKPIDSTEKLPKEITRLTLEQNDAKDKAGAVLVKRSQWYEPAYYYMADVRQLLQKNLSKDDYKGLLSIYRQALITQYNEGRAKHGQKPVSASPVLLAHPNLALFVDAESKHPIKLMGCTVCHEGSGQETQFEHTVHTPRKAWVDEKTGAVVPEFLVKEEGEEHAKPAAHAAAEKPEAKEHAVAAASASGAVYTHFDVKLTDPTHPAPFAPETGEQAEEAGYFNPATGETSHAIPQEEYWTQHYGWEEVHFMHWEKPMHRLDYVESSCTRCHNQVYDIKDEAPKLFEGRKLFAQLGCINCHQVDGLKDAMDIKKVGPDLGHIKDKISPEMMASWIWSPKAFRPMTRMPHFFMLENNSAPVDILRTRTEVAAITYYLLHTEPSLDVVLRDQQALESELAQGPAAARAAEIQAKLDKSDTDLKELRSRLESSNGGLDVNNLLDEQHKLHQDLAKKDASPEDFNQSLQKLAQVHGKLEDHVHKYAPEKPTAKAGDPKNGLLVFNTVGCLACHTNMNEFGERWITEDLTKRTGISKEDAKKQYGEMSYNQRHWYALEHLQEKLVLIGPELSGVGTKLKAGRTEEQARAWVFDWVKNPRHFSSTTIMPNFRLSDDEANDVAAYLLTLERPDYKPVDFLKLDDSGTKMLAELAANFKAVSVPMDVAREVIAGKQVDVDNGTTKAWTREEQLKFVGKKVIAHYGCNGCHTINGFENAAQPCAQLDEWGVKDPHKLDFGYFEHAFDKDRETPIKLWKVSHEGLASDAPQITADGKTGEVHQLEVEWEKIPNERRPWLYNKIHNTRIYDRGHTQLNGNLDGGAIDLGKPYDKLKMPKFFLNDTQVRSLVTFVTSIRKPLVNDGLIAKTYTDERLRVAHGRQLATMYNCYGCHNIEANDAHFHDFLPVHNADGSKDMGKLNDFAPPRLIGEGSRTQPEWLHDFLLNVRPIRPWLMVRMPSFPVSDFPGGVVPGSTPAPNDSASYLVEYFGGATQLLGKRVGRTLTPIEDFIKASPTKDWTTDSSMAEPRQKLLDLGIYLDQAKAADFDPRQTEPDDRKANWGKLLDQVRFLSEVYQIHYPFPGPPHITASKDSFARGEAFYTENCKQCHNIGDEDVMAKLKAKLERATTKPAPAPKQEDDGFGDAPAAKTDKPAAATDEFGDAAPAAGATAATDESSPDMDVPMLKTTMAFGGAGFGPNLINVSRRIQYNWADHWVRGSLFIHPGTRMPIVLGTHGESAYAAIPDPAARKAKESRYGYTGAEQRQYILDFIYTAGQNHYTPGESQLYGAPPPAPPDLKPLPEPPPPPVAAVKTPAEGASASKEPAAAKPAQAVIPAAPEPVKVELTVSTIQLQDGPISPFDTTRVVGEVKFDGKAPPRRAIDMSQDPVCKAAHGGAQPLYPISEIVNPDGTMQNVFIYVKNGVAPGKAFPAPPPLVLNQHGCEYVPHVAGVMVGQTIQLKNDDNTVHNVHLYSQQKSDYNKSMQPGTGENLKLTKPEMATNFKCDVHPWMSGFVYVMPHPFFAVTDVQGRYEIKGLPPGKYTLEALVEPSKDFKPAPVTFEVAVEDKTSHRADVKMTR